MKAIAAIGWIAASLLAVVSVRAQSVTSFTVVGDRIEQPLTPRVGDAARGRALALARDTSCILCHALPEPEQRFYGDLAPTLAGIGARLSVAQLRLRIVDSRRVNPQTIMPAYHVVDGLNRVASAYRDKPLLTPEQIEDLIAYLASLK